MSLIDDLISTHCPRGVEYKPLGVVGRFTRGSGIQKSDFVDEGVGCIHYGEIHTHYGMVATETRSKVPASGNWKMASPGDLVITTTSEDDAAVGKAVAWLGTERVAVSTDALILCHDMSPKFVSYFFQTESFQSQKARHLTGTKVRRISSAGLSTIRIPVPPREVQDEVVRVLDVLGELEAELESQLKAELDARRRQYDHYSASLVVPSGESTGSAPLGEVAAFKYGYTASAADAGDYRFIRITDITDSGTLSRASAKFVGATADVADYVVRRGDLLMARTGGTFGKTLHISEDMEAIYASFLIRIRVDRNRLMPRFYWHFSRTENYWRQARALASHGGQPQFNGNALKNVIVPLPSLDEQARVVEVLDAFDALATETSVALSAELNARRQQYEHYRERLLAFEEAL